MTLKVGDKVKYIYSDIKYGLTGKIGTVCLVDGYNPHRIYIHWNSVGLPDKWCSDECFEQVGSEKEQKMPSFKVGDNVRLTCPHEKLTPGEIGIVEFFAEGQLVGVKFSDEPTAYFPPQVLEKVYILDSLGAAENEPKPKFKVGDKVKIIDKQSAHLNQIGTVEIIGSVYYHVLFPPNSMNPESHSMPYHEHELELVNEKTNSKFKVGDRVVVKKDYDGDGENFFKGFDFGGGTIIYSNPQDMEATIGVEFDKEFYHGHGCGGFGKESHCRWFSVQHLELVEPSSPEHTLQLESIEPDFINKFEGWYEGVAQRLADENMGLKAKIKDLEAELARYRPREPIETDDDNILPSQAKRFKKLDFS